MNVKLDRSNQDFGGSGIFELRMFLHWGVADIDKSKVNQWNSKYIGDVVFDKKFNIYEPEAQKSLLDFCDDLDAQKFVVKNTMRCWI